MLRQCSNPECGKSEKSRAEFKKCGFCKSVQYCGKECQRVHWKMGHKKECKRLKSELEKSRQAAQSVGALPMTAEMAEMQQRHAEVYRHLLQTTARIREAGRTKHLNELTYGYVKDLDDDVKMYRSIGKMFVATPYRECVDLVTGTIAEKEEDIRKQKDVEEVLERELKACADNLKEMMANYRKE